MKGSDNKRMQVREFHKGRREPFPKVIRVYERQKVELFESKYFLSVYPTEKCKLDLQVETKEIHYQSEEATSQSDEVTTYGPYTKLPPLSFSQISVFFTFPYALPYFSKATRDVFVSHWGSIAIDEYFSIFNGAAGINGQFSRVDYMPHINPNNGANAIQNLAINLP